MYSYVTLDLNTRNFLEKYALIELSLTTFRAYTTAVNAKM